jgi:anti-sigma factor RsiW
MTCGDVAQHLDAFVDAELPAPTLLAIARHAGSCSACDVAVRALETLHETIERTAREDAATLDLAGVWPAVDAGIARVDARRKWTRRARALPAWGVGLAAAASVFLLVRTPAEQQAQAPAPAPARVVSARPRPNQAVIERLDSAAQRFELRRERRDGTTLIMVSTEEEISR